MKLITVLEYSRKHKISRMQVYRMIRDGRLKGVIKYGRQFIKEN